MIATDYSLHATKPGSRCGDANNPRAASCLGGGTIRSRVIKQRESARAADRAGIYTIACGNAQTPDEGRSNQYHWFYCCCHHRRKQKWLTELVNAGCLATHQQCREARACRPADRLCIRGSCRGASTKYPRRFGLALPRSALDIREAFRTLMQGALADDELQYIFQVRHAQRRPMLLRSLPMCTTFSFQSKA